MRELFVLNTSKDLTVTEDFSGYIIFYKKAIDKTIAKMQYGLFQKLIENGLKLSLSNFLFIDVKEQALRIATLKKQLEIHKCFLFGVQEREVGVNFNLPLYKLTTFSGIDFVRADAPEVLESDKNLKSKLWTQLQLSFNL